jgi:hypothetical protein
VTHCFISLEAWQLRFQPIRAEGIPSTLSIQCQIVYLSFNWNFYFQFSRCFWWWVRLCLSCNQCWRYFKRWTKGHVRSRSCRATSHDKLILILWNSSSLVTVERATQLLVLTEPSLAKSAHLSPNVLQEALLPPAAYASGASQRGGSQAILSTEPGLRPLWISVHLVPESCPSHENHPQNEWYEKDPLSNPKCGNTFTDLIRMESHTKLIHNAPRDFKCGLCPKAFTSTNNLSVHKRQIHEKAPVDPRKLVCKYCGKQTRDPQALFTHLKLHSKARQLSYCKLCNEKLSCPASLKRHIRLVHVNPGISCEKAEIGVDPSSEGNIFL